MLQQVNDIRYKFYDYHLKKKLVSVADRRQSKPMNFRQADTIGILFDATKPASRVFINEYRELLINKDKQVSILGYFDDRQDHQNVIFKYFNNKDLNWCIRPVILPKNLRHVNLMYLLVCTSILVRLWSM